jgi:His-Xaa-Ser system radical SAM maturase HxsC
MENQEIMLNAYGKIGCGGFVMSRIVTQPLEEKERSILACKHSDEYIAGYSGYFFYDDVLPEELMNQLRQKRIPFLYGVEQLLIFEERDIVVIDEKYGVIYRIFRSESKDNAIMITNICNSNCIFCPESEGSRSKMEEIPFSYFEQLISLIPENTESLCLTGGEPTCSRQNFVEVLKLCKNYLLNTRIQILSNSRAFSVKSFVSQLEPVMPPFVLLGTALHSDQADIHDQITQVSGSFLQTIQGIRNMMALQVQVEVRIVISRFNMNSLVDMVDFVELKLKGIQRITFMGMELQGNAAKNREDVWADYRSTGAELKKAIYHCVELGIEPAIYNIPLCAMDESLWQFSYRSISDYKVFYPEECSGCQVKEYCSGFFRSTYRLAQPKVKSTYVRGL